MPQRLKDVPEPPSELVYLYGWFREVFTGEALTYNEIEAWSRLTRRSTEPFEVEVLKTLENIYWQVTNEQRVRESNS